MVSKQPVRAVGAETKQTKLKLKHRPSAQLAVQKHRPSAQLYRTGRGQERGRQEQHGLHRYKDQKLQHGFGILTPKLRAPHRRAAVES